MIETTSADATRDGYKGSAKPLTLEMRRRFLSISIPPSQRPPFRKGKGETEYEWQRKYVWAFFDKTIIPICICLITWCVNLQPFRFNLALFNAASRWGKGFPVTCFDIFPQTVIFSQKRVPLFLPVGANLSASWSQSSRKYREGREME